MALFRPVPFFLLNQTSDFRCFGCLGVMASLGAKLRRAAVKGQRDEIEKLLKHAHLPVNSHDSVMVCVVVVVARFWYIVFCGCGTLCSALAMGSRGTSVHVFATPPQQGAASALPAPQCPAQIPTHTN